MKKPSFNLILGVFFAFTLCLMTSCEKEKAVGKIQGTVTNATNNDPIQGVNISLNPSGASVVTGSDGGYEFNNLEAGQYTVQGVKSGYETVTKSVTVTAGNVLSCDMQLQPTANPDDPNNPDNPNNPDDPNDDVVVGDGLFCYFTFDDDEIVDFYDNFTGINNGASASTDTPSGEGKSLQFDGENSYVIVEDDIVPIGNVFSMNIWFKTNYSDQALVGSDIHAGGNRCAALVITSNYNVRYFPNTSANNWKTEGTITSCIDNHWHMLTLTYDGTAATIYVDGEMFESKSSPDLIWGRDINVSYIGADATNSLNGYFKGKLDNFRSYIRALTAQEVKMLFDAKQ